MSTTRERISDSMSARFFGATTGCTARRCDAHHLTHWAHGGATRLDNLVHLCRWHHRAVHEGGYRIERDFRDCWYFLRPDGIAVPSSGYRYSDTYDIPPAGGLLSVAEKTVSEPAAPDYLH